MLVPWRVHLQYSPFAILINLGPEQQYQPKVVKEGTPKTGAFKTIQRLPPQRNPSKIANLSRKFPLTCV